jgi:NAD(P)H dehydrogenase (quinone)
MLKVLILYDSRTGNTEKMAEKVAEGAKTADVDVELKKVDEARLEDLENADGIILGSPTHFGTMSDKMKGFIDESIRVRKRLENKVGAAFSTSAFMGGGSETAIISLIEAMLIHGMIVVGDPIEATGHYGAIAVGAPNEKALDTCRKLGRRVGELVKRLA